MRTRIGGPHNPSPGTMPDIMPLKEAAMTKSQLLAIRKMKPLLDELVEQKLLELLGDPDEGLQLKPAARRRIMERLDKSKLVSASKAASRLGLKW